MHPREAWKWHDDMRYTWRHISNDESKRKRRKQKEILNEHLERYNERRPLHRRRFESFKLESLALKLDACLYIPKYVNWGMHNAAKHHHRKYSCIDTLMRSHALYINNGIVADARKPWSVFAVMIRFGIDG